MAYLAPGYGPDDDPGAVIVGDVMADIGVEVDVVGLGYPNLSGPAVVGPAIKSWRPDPALAAVVRGVRDAAELERWRRTLTQEFGNAVRLRARIWTSTMWHDLREPPATFPLTLRAEPTDASHERSASRLRDVFETLRGPVDAHGTAPRRTRRCANMRSRRLRRSLTRSTTASLLKSPASLAICWPISCSTRR